jgi:signal transduction histidine kinase
MSKFRDYSITTKLTATNMLVSGVTLLLACAAFGGYELTTFQAAMVRRLSIEAQIVGANSASALLFGDGKSAEDTLSALKAAPMISSGGIYSPTGQPLAMFWRDAGRHALPLPPMPAGQSEEHWFTNKELILIRSIAFQGKLIGTVYIRSDLQEMNDRMARYAETVAAVLSLSLLAAFLLSTMLQRAATRPILNLAEAAKTVSRRKDYSVRAPATGTTDEVGLLIGSFNEMLAEIQSRDAALQASQEQLEQRVAQRTAELDATNKELEAFTYSVAHDLRAPLRHIQGFSNALMELFGSNLEPDARKYLTRIGEGTQQMGQLIDDLLGLARIGRQELSLQTTGLNSIVKEVLRDLATETEGRNIQWEVGDMPFVDCDPGLMKQVFYNLLSNAAKYSRPRNPAVIEVGQTVVEGENVNFVRDNGVGFNMKYAHKLFGVFQRLHRKEDFEGTGVGLATVQRIIHKHGGRIWVEAQIDKGATFFFNLSPSTETANGKL